MRIYEFLDLTGKRFGRWTAIARGPNDENNLRWLCKCDCGQERLVYRNSLTTGKSKSCGCLRNHGFKALPEYQAWVGMKTRCRYHRHYAGRGISVCKKWEDSFIDFYADMGPRPSPKHQIDRIDNDGDYEPANCRWADRKQQCNNRQSSRKLTFAGETLTVSQWAERTGIDNRLIRARIDVLKWPIAKALTVKP